MNWPEYLAHLQKTGKEGLHFAPIDQHDITVQYSGLLGQGWVRWIKLREGIELLIERTQNHNRLLSKLRLEMRLLKWHFILFGKQKT
ncbi:MAG: hypothetical protein AAGG02_05810, partial [Cyanobacteria bacterium P01_H01_bin.15]